VKIKGIVQSIEKIGEHYLVSISPAKSEEGLPVISIRTNNPLALGAFLQQVVSGAVESFKEAFAPPYKIELRLTSDEYELLIVQSGINVGDHVTVTLNIEKEKPSVEKEEKPSKPSKPEEEETVSTLGNIEIIE